MHSILLRVCSFLSVLPPLLTDIPGIREFAVLLVPERLLDAVETSAGGAQTATSAFAPPEATVAGSVLTVPRAQVLWVLRLKILQRVQTLKVSGVMSKNLSRHLICISNYGFIQIISLLIASLCG